MNCGSNGVWRLKESIAEVVVPKGADEVGSFLVQHPVTQKAVQVSLAGTKLQPGDLTHIDELGNIKKVYSDEERGWFWYSIARSGVLVFASSFLVVYTLALGKEFSNNDGKMEFFGARVAPSTAVTASLLISFVVIAFMSPIIGALADFTSHRKLMFGGFALLGVACTFALVPMFYARNLPACYLLTYAIPFCYEITISLMYAYLPEITEASKIPKLSGYGLFLTTLFQVLSLVIFVPLMSLAGNVENKTSSDPQIQFYYSLCSIIIGVVWFVGTILTLLLLKSRPARRWLEPGQSLWTIGFVQLTQVGRKAKLYPQLFRFLLSYILSSIAFGTVTSIASIVLSADFGWSGTQLAYLLVGSQIVAMLGGLTAHRLSNRFGPRRLLLIIIAVYTIASPLFTSLYYARESCVLNDWTLCPTTGKCYREYSALTLTEANDKCSTEASSHNGQVAVFRSSAEMTCGGVLCTDPEGCLLDRQFSLNKWHDSDGKVPTFWFTQDSREPSPVGGNCVSYNNSSSFWQTVSCNTPLSFVCEKDAAEEANSLLSAIMFAIFLIMTYFGGLNIAISRAYLALMVPPDLEAEMYGLYALCGKLLIWFGVALFAISSEVFGDFRWAFLWIVPFYLLGFWSLYRIDTADVTNNVKEYMLARRSALEVKANILPPQRQNSSVQANLEE
eukprot:c32285_g1_i1.p1 GENE.c32285_g1_i1~~c32285_g1_i1.p1  ORF type:complete len:674 (+),score=154.61 c32285_g1_i1:75-2096(+)